MLENDGLQDVFDCVQLALSALRTARAGGHESEATRSANDYLHDHLLNYLVLMRQRPLTSTYEYLVPVKGSGVKPGWYWRHPKRNPRDWVNWHGPYPTRKAAVEARMRQPGAMRTPIEVLDREIFSEEDTANV